MEETKGWLTFKIIVFYCFLSSARASMTLGDNAYVDLLLSGIAFIVVPRQYFIHTPIRTYAAFFLALASMYTMWGATIAGYLAQLSMVLIPIYLIYLKKEYQFNLFNSLSNWFAILLAASVVWWILWLIGIPLPHFSQKIPWQHNDYGFIHQNYILFRHTIDLSPYAVIPSFLRFGGFFLEPGHMGTICAVFLYANKFDMTRWRNIIFIVVIILTFSSAAYALAILGYCFYRFTIDRWKVVLPIIATCLAVLIVMQYNGGDNILNDIVIGKFTREQGAVEGRFSVQTQQLWNQSIEDGSVFFGLGAGAQLKESAGYKVFILMNGIFGTILTLIAYWLIQQINYTKLGVMFFILMVVSFLQRTYCFWDAFLDPYILGTSCLLFTTEKEQEPDLEDELP